jgi:hypothetical protein
MAKGPGKRPPAKAKAPARKSAAPKAPPAKAKAQPKAPAPKRQDRRGTPKGKGSVAGRNGGRIGNPAHEPTPELRKLAETHAAVGTPHWAIAIEMGISEDTLNRHYDKELKIGLIRMNARVGSSVAKKALDGDPDMQKFWLARRGGAAWMNKQSHEIGGIAGRPIETRDMSKLSNEQLAALAALDDQGE